jgi:epoxide hydrolase 4
MRERRLKGSGVTLHAVESGDGPALLLLHGFPDLGWGWRHQWTALADAGYRVVVPDLRGYGRSDRPRGVEAYAMRHLVADVTAVLEAEDEPAAGVVGHDWGGVIAWSVAARRPDLMRRLVILNAPHGTLLRRELRSNPRQLLRSWYAGFHQLPLLPELAWRAGNQALLRRVLGRTESGERMASEDELRPYLDAFSRPGAMTAALNYYRAAAHDILGGRSTGGGIVDVPTLVIWGARDPFLDQRLLEGLEDVVRQVSVERLPHAGHWAHWQDPGTVNELILAFLD